MDHRIRNQHPLSELPGIRVLFQSRDNPLRAQLAEHLLKHLGKGHFVVCSLPEQPVDPRVTNVLAELKIETTPEVAAVTPGNDAPDSFDYIITMCDQSTASCDGRDELCPNIPDNRPGGCWAFANPLDADSEEGVLTLLRRVRDEMSNRLCIWIPAAMHAHRKRNTGRVVQASI